jgi:membrane-associated phospholipid phosphatase
MRIPKALLVAALLASLGSVLWAQDEKQTATPASGAANASAPQPKPNSNDKSEKGSDGWLPPGEDPDNKLGLPFLRHIASDQEQFWSSPVHFKTTDLKWIVPFAGTTAGLIAGDSWISKQIPNKPNQLTRSLHISDYSTYALIGVGGGSFLLGQMTHNDHLSETGLLSGEAAINSTGISYLLKEITQRPRPNAGNGDGQFFQGGQSFTSEHSAIAWSIASVWAHEYPSTLSQILAYGLASAVTVTRVTAQQHFSSDVFVGSALGWYFGRQVYRAHHDPELGGTSWDSLLPDDTGDKPRNPANMGSPYVPLDSWVYPALERLAAMGYIHSEYAGMRPWTRMECARLLEEAQDQLADDAIEENEQAGKLYETLQTEFAPETGRLGGAENLGANLDSVYTRVTGISGTPLTDGYHFGQTIINDYGRPYGEGFNNVTGFTSHAQAGPFSISVQGEYQHAPAAASDPLSVLQASASQDGVAPLQDGSPTINRFRVIEGSIGFTFMGVKASFGKQNLWLGPGESGSLLLSDNAEPITMLQLDTVSPLNIPLLSRLLGPARMNFFVGQLSGQTWVYSPSLAVGLNPGADPRFLVGPNLNPQPFIHGNKISFHPTANLEFGMGVTAIFGGPGLPFTWHEFLRSYYGHDANTATNPAKRFSSFDFTYRIPGLRKWLTFYTDSIVGDEISPIGSTRPMLNLGIYLPQLPKLPKLELRMEGFKANPRLGTMYFDRRYRSGYTNDGNLIGSWVGRQALGGQAWAKYSFDPRTSVQLGYRHQEVDRFLLGGGHLNDFSVAGEFMLGSRASLSGQAQYERWNFPVLRAGSQSDISESLELKFYPRWRL